MIKTTAMLLNELKDFADPYGKIRRLCKEKKLIKLTRELYETDRDKPGCVFAPVLYGPSYLSFDYALARYGLIPEAVHEYTSATCGKGKKKRYSNYFGDYSYRDIPARAYPFETRMIEDEGYFYLLASPEKALCDKLYTMSPVRNRAELCELLFSNLRIDEEELRKLNAETVEELSKYYNCNNIRFLSAMLRRTK